MVVWMHGRMYRSLVPPPWLGGSKSEINRTQIAVGRVDLVGRVDFGGPATSNRGRQGRFRRSKGVLEASRAITNKSPKTNPSVEKLIVCQSE